MAKKETRSNLFEVILYPESLPSYFLEVLEDTKVPCLLSPCHNMDVYNKFDEVKAQDTLEKIRLGDLDSNENEIKRLESIKEGKTKKEHYHLLVNYGASANKTINQVQQDFVYPLNAKLYPNFVKSERGLARYLVHMDHPDKFQYRLDEVRNINGYQTKDFFDLSNKDEQKTLVAIMDIIDRYNIVSYAELMKVCSVWKPYLSYCNNHTIMLKAYIESSISQDLQGKRIEELQEALKKSLE